MTIIDKLLELSDQIARALLKSKKPKKLYQSELFTEDEKNYILGNFTNPEKNRQRKLLLDQIDKRKDWQKIQNKIQMEEKTPVRYLTYVKYAAVLVLLLGISFYFLYNNSPNPNTVVHVPAAEITPGTDKATLVLGNGQIVVLGKGNKYNSNGIHTDDTHVTYDPSKDKIEFNYLTIPRGGQFSLQLEDGTRVWLNSHSKLKFPNRFTDGKSRVVELVYGEAYFDVSPSVEHKGSKFNVMARGQSIEVIGTQFNVKAYSNEQQIFTTLVSGKIKLQKDQKSVFLNPEQQSIVNLSDDVIKVKNVIVYNEISWKDGEFSFQDMPLKDIMKVLERWYDVDIYFKNKDIENLRFTGIVDKNQKIQDLLNIINATHNIPYEIKEKTIILK